MQTVPREGYRFVGDVAVQGALRLERQARHARPMRGVGPHRAAARFGSSLAVAAVLAVAVVLALAGWRWSTSAADRDLAAADEGDTASRITPFTSGGISAVKPVFAPDGKSLLYQSDTERHGVLDFFLLPLDGAEPWRLTHGVNASGDIPVFTADGREVVFSRYRTGPDGSRLPDSVEGVVVRRSARSLHPGSERGGIFAGRRMGGIYATRSLPHARSSLSPTDRLDQRREVSTPGFTPRWSPDGRWLALPRVIRKGSGRHLGRVASLAERRRLTNQSDQMYGLTWSADSARSCSRHGSGTRSTSSGSRSTAARSNR